MFILTSFRGTEVTISLIAVITDTLVPLAAAVIQALGIDGTISHTVTLIWGDKIYKTRIKKNVALMKVNTETAWTSLYGSSTESLSL